MCVTNVGHPLGMEIQDSQTFGLATDEIVTAPSTDLFVCAAVD